MGADVIAGAGSLDAVMLVGYASIVSGLLAAGWGAGRLAGWAVHRRRDGAGERVLNRLSVVSMPSEGWS